jgi:hypothetical protein
MTASKLSRMKVVGILRFGAILEVDKIPGGFDPKGICLESQFQWLSGRFSISPFAWVNYFQSN